MCSLLGWFRSARAALAAVVLAALCSGPLVLPHADPAGDTACEPALAAHDASAHRFTPGSPPGDSHAQHCFTCHWARSFPVLLRASTHVEAPASSGEGLHAPAVQPRHHIAWALVPGRAPPA